MQILASIFIAVMMSTTFLFCSTPENANCDPKSVMPEPDKPGNAVLVGEYQYTGFDDKGIKIIEGRLTITSADPRRIGNETQTQIKGSWDLKEIVHRDHIGGQVGQGDLTGGIVNGEVILDLNPNMSDANVVLKGHLNGNQLSGTWSFNGYAGPVTHGTFEAVKK